MNCAEKFVFRTVFSFGPVSAREIINKKTLDLTSDDITRAIWSLVDGCKIEFTDDRKLCIAEKGRKVTIAKYRKKPVVVEAVQLCWRNWNEVCDFLGSIISDENPGRWVKDYSDTCGEEGDYVELTIPTLEGDHLAKHGDYIIKGINGEFYPCKPDVFKKLYEHLEE